MSLFNILRFVASLLQRIVIPLYRRFHWFARFHDIFISLVLVLTRFANGFFAGKDNGSARPVQTLVLYEFEGCPFCRKVREAISVLDLDVLIKPCPRETYSAYGVCIDSRYRPEVKKAGGKLQFPYLVDPNTNTAMYESDAIIEYLWQTYGDKTSKPFNYWLVMESPLRSFLFFCHMLASMFLRNVPEQGMIRTPSKPATLPLEYWGHQGSNYCVIVREVLTTLELQHVSHALPHGSPKRAQFAKDYASLISNWRKAANLVMIPLLYDPNTNTTLVESDDIKEYLYKTYKTGPFTSETYSDYNTKQPLPKPAKQS
eukprot:m.31091 g.31091  ORF g.31091 m.31091 type:complete len:315 (+) comp9374_c0_seq1:1483-2427(+)